MHDYRVVFDELPWVAPRPGVRYKVVRQGARQLRLVEFAKELDHPEWCTTGHFGYVLDGLLEIEFDDRVVTLQAGDGLLLPAGQRARHRPRAVSDKALLFFVEDVE